jgi:hypothetical protein
VRFESTGVRGSKRRVEPEKQRAALGGRPLKS